MVIQLTRTIQISGTPYTGRLRAMIVEDQLKELCRSRTKLLFFKQQMMIILFSKLWYVRLY